MHPFTPYNITVGFNKPASYGPHEGADFNLGGTSGNQDCGTPIKCIFTGEVIHVSKSTKDYGNLIVVECKTTRGTRWVRYCHLDEQRIVSGLVKRGEIIGTMGDTGNSTACHLHLDCLKKKPTSWRFYSKSILDWYEDPEIIINDIIESTMDYQWLEQMFLERGIEIKQGETQVRNKVQGIFDKAKKYDDEVPALKQQIISTNEALADRAREVSVLTENNQRLSDAATEAQEQLNTTRSERNTTTSERDQEKIKNTRLVEELEVLSDTVIKLKSEKPISSYSWFERLLSLFGR